MKDDLTVEEMIRGLKDFKNVMRTQMNDLMFQTVKDLEPEYKERIFTDGENTKGTKSYYSDDPGYWSKKYQDFWIPVRQKKGLQVDYVDLNFTGKLKSNIVPKKGTKGSAEMSIRTKKDAFKVDFQQQLQAGKSVMNDEGEIVRKTDKKKKYTNPDSIDIFGLSDSEIESAEKKMLTNLAALIRNTIVG